MNDLIEALRKKPNAQACVTGSEKYPSLKGQVRFYRVCGGVLVRAEITGLPRGESGKSPIFAFHIHEGGQCAGNDRDPFADVKGHYNPTDLPHPYHAGDLPPLFGVNGTAFSVFLTDRFTVCEILNRAVIIHAMPDDLTTQPSGNAGEKIACGIIKPTA